MNIPSWLQKRWVYHALLWLLFVIVNIFNLYLQVPEGIAVDYQETFRFLMHILLPGFIGVYAIFWGFKKYLEQKKFAAFFLLCLLVLSICTILSMYVSRPFWGLEDMGGSHDFFNMLYVLSLAAGAKFFKQSIKARGELQQLKVKTAEMELNALKAQINPHFLFNNLNNIYSKLQDDTEKGAEMVLELADVMRYHLELSSKEKVSISEEMRIIQSYIEIERLRLNDNCDLQTNIQADAPSLFIAPLILLPFIENAFKHGTHPTKSCYVHIDLSTENRTLKMWIKNSIIHDKRVVKTNVGLENTTKRLGILYEGRHDLNMTETEDDFEVQIAIEL